MKLESLGHALIICGVVLTIVPTLMVQLADSVALHEQEAETGRRLREQPRRGDGAAPVNTGRHVGERLPESPAAAIEPDAIEPGPDGYLLEIPKLRLRAVIYELEPEVFSGKNTPMLKRFGLGQVPYSAALRNVAPGAEGTAVIAGHRTTSGAPLRNLHRLGPGDLIVLRKADIEQRWTVVYAVTVEPYEVDAIRSQPGTRRLALLACSPPFSDARRLIVYAALAGKDAQ